MFLFQIPVTLLRSNCGNKVLTWVGVFSKADVQHLLHGGLQHTVCVDVLKGAPDSLCWSRSLASSCSQWQSWEFGAKLARNIPWLCETGAGCLVPQFPSLCSSANASFCPRSTARNVQKGTLLFTSCTSPAVTSCGFCGSSRRIFLFGAHSVLKDMAAVNSSVGFKEELDTTRGKSSPAILCGPGKRVRGCSASGWEADCSSWKVSGSTAVGQCRQRGDGSCCGDGCCAGSLVIIMGCASTEDSPCPSPGV